MKSSLLSFALFVLVLVSGCGDDTNVVPTPEPEPNPELPSLSEGLISHFPFSGNADDVVVPDRTGAVAGATLTTDRNDVPNNAYYFDGDNDYIVYGPSPDLSLGARQLYTFTAWVKPEDRMDNGRHIAISKFNQDVLAGWYLGINANGLVQSYRNLPPWSVAGATTQAWNEYVHLAATYDGTSLAVYINGQLDATRIFGANNNDNVTPILVGGIHSQGEIVPTFKGTIDDIRIYNRVLTTEELTWLASN